jgi:hypothetical protein
MPVRVIRFLVLVAALTGWFIYTGDNGWLKFAGCSVIFGISAVVDHLMRAKKSEPNHIV